MFKLLRSNLRRMLILATLLIFAVLLGPALPARAQVTSPLIMAEGNPPPASSPAQPSPPPKTKSSQPSQAESPPSPSRRSTKRVTYPQPPDVYNYEALRKYDESLYGTPELPQKPN